MIGTDREGLGSVGSVGSGVGIGPAVVGFVKLLSRKLLDGPPVG